jgi:hypothetical protein
MNLRRLVCLTIILIVGAGFGQIWPRQSQASRSLGPGNYVRIEGGQVVNEDEIRTARETDSHATGTPNWTNMAGFEHDVFTFTRVIFQSDPGARPRNERLRWLGWWVDYPDADLNLSYRLQQLTSARTDPDARVLKLTDPDLPDYPLIYMEHAGYMKLSDDEVGRLRNYLLNGGALFVNDFWGTEEWNGFAGEIERVLPGRSWVDLATDHPIFNCVYPLNVPMKDLQIPTMQFWNPAHDPGNPRSRLQRMDRGEGSEDVHVRAVFDDRGRMMILAIHNSDVSDGWEREGENELFFNQFSEKIAYPLGINIIFYFMTH